MINIVCDFREKPSGIPKILEENKVIVSYANLSAGDYIINDQIIVERKTAEDFIHSILDNRLFEQCSKLKKESKRLLLLVEGNPYKTLHQISAQAIKGTIVSILTSWQIPMINTQNLNDSVGMLMLLGDQSLKNITAVKLYNGHKPKRLKNQKLKFIQGIPSTDPAIAIRLVDFFGDIKSIVNACK